jgi:hypothetical protein
VNQEVVNLLLSGALAAIGWFARELWTAVKGLKDDVNLLRIEIPKTYVVREDFRADIREIKDMLSKIFDKMDTKQDKPWPTHEL